MPIINPTETDKFYALSNRIQSKQRFDKNTSIEALKTIASQPKPYSAPTISEPTIPPGPGIPNSTIRRHSVEKNVLKLDNFMQTKSGDHIYLSSSIDGKPTANESTKTKDQGKSSVALQTGGRLQELKAMHQRLLQLTRVAEPNKPVYEPRRPTMEAIKDAIEKAKREKDMIERNKNVGTDDIKTGTSLKNDAVTSTESKIEVPKKGKKGRKVKSNTSTLQNSVTRARKKYKKIGAKVDSNPPRKKS